MKSIEQILEVYEAAIAWVRSRNALSGDCASLGISGHSHDTPKWMDELLRREKPLRDIAEKYAYDGMNARQAVIEEIRAAELRGVKAGLETAAKACNTAYIGCYEKCHKHDVDAIEAIDPASVVIQPETVDKTELEALCEESKKRDVEEGGEWTEYTGDGK